MAAPQAATDIHQDVATETDRGVLEFLWRTRSVISNVGYTIKDITNGMNKSTSCMNSTFQGIADWAKTVEARLAEVEKGQTRGASHPRDKPISEIKAVINLE